MLSGLMVSPTLDLGGRSRNDTSGPRPTPTSTITVDTLANSINSVTRAAVSIEYASLRHNGHCPTGMYITPPADSILVWDAVLFVHKGHYAGSVLKFVMTFPDNYPDRPPTVCFVTDVFHPLVATQTGMFNLTARFRPWRPKEHHVHDILFFVKSAFKDIALEKVNEVDVANKEAFKYTEDRSSFTALAKQSSQLSQSPSALYDVPSTRKTYSFHFAPTNPEQAKKVLETLSIQTCPEHSNSQTQ